MRGEENCCRLEEGGQDVNTFVTSVTVPEPVPRVYCCCSESMYTATCFLSVIFKCSPKFQ
jgi:hypothetical protein